MKLEVKTSDMKDLIKQLEKNEKTATKVVRAVISDMRRRLPGKVADEVTDVYNIKKTEITPRGKGKKAKTQKKAGSIRIKGKAIEDLTFVYSGRFLTPTHFAMRPTTPPKRVKGRRPKPITAEVKKGHRKSLGKNVFLAKAPPINNEQTTEGDKVRYLPFQRTTKKRYPIEAVKRVSVPQMVENEKVRPDIDKDINELLNERLNHQIKRFFK